MAFRPGERVTSDRRTRAEPPAIWYSGVHIRPSEILANKTMSAIDIKRIAVFTGNPSEAVMKNIVEMDRALPGVTWLVLVHRPARSVLQIMRAQWRNLYRNGWRRIPTVISALRRRMTIAEMGSIPVDAPGMQFTLAAIMARGNVRLVQVNDIHSDEALDITRSFMPDIGLSLGAPILKRALFGIPRLGTLNLHKGRLPDYRGMPPAFWELWNGDSAVGCTVHWVDDKLDTGPIAAATEIECERYSTVRGLQLSLDEVGLFMVRDTVKAITQGSARSYPQPEGGCTYRSPTLGQIAQLQRRIAGRQPPSDSFPRRVAKNVVTGSAFSVARRAIGRLTPPRATVVLYHRVADGARDDLTVGIEQFDRQMALLRRYFDVVSLADMLDWDTIPKTGRPLVGVTFDDGYFDNYLNAAPILERHQIPATFFVSTGIVGTDRRFPHDIRRGNPWIPLMDWNNIRELRDAGFGIGSHTVNHIDCAAESEDVVRAELEKSRDDLRRELGLEEIIFSYPYGGRQHMTPQRLELVKQAGYVGCVSAYGGANVGKIDPFNVLRSGGGHWEFSDRAFLYASLGF